MQWSLLSKDILFKGRYTDSYENVSLENQNQVFFEEEGDGIPGGKIMVGRQYVKFLIKYVKTGI